MFIVWFMCSNHVVGLNEVVSLMLGQFIKWIILWEHNDCISISKFKFYN